jgi:hypothetical protein
MPNSDPRKNQLLAALPDLAWNRWRQQLESIELRLGVLSFSVQ